MEDSLRRLVAFVCGCYVLKQHNNFIPTRIFDFENNEYTPMNIQFNDYGFNLYDYGRQTYANGTCNNIYDFATQKTVNCVFNNSAFNGFLEDNSFQGIVSGYNVSILDYSEEKYYNYILS